MADIANPFTPKGIDDVALDEANRIFALNQKWPNELAVYENKTWTFKAQDLENRLIDFAVISVGVVEALPDSKAWKPYREPVNPIRHISGPKLW